VITAEHLSKRYGAQQVVHDVSFTCRPGTITGFLGPNGAGKSTTLRMLVGLSRPDSGRTTIDGLSYAELPNPGRVVGTLLDPSAMHPGRTGRATLTLAATVTGAPVSRIPEVLRTVGLADSAADKRVGNYSLGMRQRLGIAQALLSDPAVLILDEPANGLDPEGIKWMRSMLQDFAARGGTVLLSSHLLHEVEATVDELVVIGGGEIVAAGSMADLLSGTGLVVRAIDDAALRAALDRAGLAYEDRAEGGVKVLDAPAEQVGPVLAEARVALLELRADDRRGLEDLFFALTDRHEESAA
jgi:ABC-2 type transport system ATP-binding protein